MEMFLILYYRINSMGILKFFSSKEKYNSIITFYSIMNLDEVLHYRRSVRAYDRTKLIDPERIKHCLELATLAPNSSDMQLWEFYHITQPELLARFQELVSIRKPLLQLHKKSFSWCGVIGTGNMRGLYLTSSGRISGVTVRKNVRPNASKTGNYTMAN